MTDPKTFEKFQPILEYTFETKFVNQFWSITTLKGMPTFKKWFVKWTNIAQRKPLKAIKVKSGRLQKSTNMCSFLTKRHWFCDAWKISSDLDAVWWVATWTNIPQRKPLKAIEVKSGRLQKSTNMCVEYSKLSFFINDDWSEDFWKVSTNFGILCQLSKIQPDETKW